MGRISRKHVHRAAKCEENFNFFQKIWMGGMRDQGRSDEVSKGNLLFPMGTCVYVRKTERERV